MKTALISTTTVRIDAADDLDAAQLDALIRQLITLRAELQPPVPGHVPLDVDVQAIQTPATRAVPLTDGGVRLYLRHAGLGWLTVTVDSSQVAAWRHVLDVAATIQPDTGPDLAHGESPGGAKH